MLKPTSLKDFDDLKKCMLSIWSLERQLFYGMLYVLKEDLYNASKSSLIR